MEEDNRSRLSEYSQDVVEVSAKCHPILFGKTSVFPITYQRNLKYELGKIAIASVVLSIVLVFTGMSLLTSKMRMPPMPALPDIIHDSAPFFNSAEVLNIMIMIVIGTELITQMLSPLRFHIFYRMLVVYTLLMALRNITIIATSLPDPNPVCLAYQGVPIDFSFKNMMREVFLGQTCGDLIFSGHTIGLLLPVLMHMHYHRSIVSYFLLAICIVGLYLIVAARLHYTIDVIVAVMFTTMIFWLYHLLAENPSLASYLPSLVVFYFQKAEWISEEDVTCGHPLL